MSETPKISKTLEHYARVILGLHKNFEPHPAQIQIGRALFNDNCRDIFVQAGRNAGKSHLAAYLLWRWAMFNPGSENYYFAPYMKQAREIVWAPKLLPYFGPREWTEKPNDTEMRVKFANGSFIKCDGSDNTDAYRGVKPKGLIILDEFKDFRPEFIEAFDPNRAAHNAPMLIFGTPPDRQCQFSEVREVYKSDPKKRYFHFPTSTNPHISKKWLDDKRAELEARGDFDVWQREYEAIEVYGGSQKIFPMLAPAVIKPYDEIMKKLAKDKKRIEWLLWADPAAASTFAVLFIAYNPYTSEIYCLDEVYEQDQEKMTVRQIGQRTIDMRTEIQDRFEWRQGYDEAETWFMSEMLDNFGEHFEPSQKSANDKESGLTLIKDMLLLDKLIISDRCEKLFWELDNYYKNKNGDIPKTDDHLIDCLRYILAALFYQIPERVDEPEKNDPHSRRLATQFPNTAAAIQKGIRQE